MSELIKERFVNHCLILAIVFCLSPFACHKGYSQSPIRLILPLESPGKLTPFSVQKIYSNQNGIRLEIEKHGFDHNGYAVFKIDVEAKASIAKDRAISIQLSVFDESSTEGAKLEVSKDAVLKANAQKTDVTIMVPQIFVGRRDRWSFAFKVQVNDKFDQQLSTNRMTFGLKNVDPNAGSRDGIQAIVPYAFSQTSLAQSDFRESPRSRTGQVQFFSDNLYRSQLKQSLTENWLSYSSADVVKIKSNMIEMSIRSQPNEWQSLMDWVATGGNLWIEETGALPSSLQKITKQLNLEDWHFDLSKDGETRTPSAEGWKYDSIIVKSKKQTATGTDDKVAIAERIKQAAEEIQKTFLKKPDTAGWYCWYPYGLGRVYAFVGRVEEYPSDIERNQRRSAFTKLHSLNWQSRHGLVLGEKCSTFANLLIPGVGIAPVVEFQVLITLFVLLIGPLNYWLLHRMSRLHLLVLTTPLLAAVITLCLLTYAAISDGFGVQARARSLTLLNQEEGKAVTWNRMTHYAGTSPKEGLAFDADAAIYPIIPGYESAIAATKPKDKAMFWKDDRQNLITGWLPNRTAVQHLLVRHGESNQRIELLKDKDNRLEALNKLGTDIEWLLVHDSDEDWKVGYEIPEGENRFLEPVELSKAIVDFRILTIENKPAMPEGAGKQAGEMLANFGNSRVSRDFGSANMNENLLNRFLDQLSGVDGSKGFALPERSYVAVTREAVVAQLGLEEITESGSFHVTVGKW